MVTNEKSKDNTIPEGKWSFDGDVTASFDNMLERSIPQYEVMRQTCFQLGINYVQKASHIVDLGCSRGEALAPFVQKYGAYNRYVGVEISKPMLETARERYKGWIETGYVDIKELDLRTDYPPVHASLTLSILTIQFTPMEYRLEILRNIYKSTLSEGAFIFVEKVLGNSAEIDKAMVGIYYDMKRNNGYTDDQIERKRLSLEGVLVPVTAKFNEELLRMVGWSQVDCFWRWMNFAGWIAIKN